MDEKKAVQPIEEMLERLNVAAVFGAPVKEGGVTLIPVARVAYGFGYGYGAGVSHEPAAESTPVETAEGSGAGGGGGGVARPLGFIRIDANGARYEPMVDPTRVPLAGILMIMWAVFWVAKTIQAFVRK